MTLITPLGEMNHSCGHVSVLYSRTNSVGIRTELAVQADTGALCTINSNMKCMKIPKARTLTKYMGS